MVERDTDRYRSLTRRALMLGGIQAGLLSTLVGRMYYLQVLQSDRYTMLAEENRINMRLLSPSRGQILDRFGVPLAVNQQNFRVVMVSEQARKIDRMLNLISEIVPLTDADFRRITREIQRKRAFVPVTVKENLTWEQVTMIEVNAPDLPGVSIDVGELRNYPYEAATAHLLGYVGVVSESELNGDPVLTLPGFRIGKAGVEKFHDANLRGVAGTSQLEVNAVGRVIRELSRDEGQPGRDVTLTIDIGLQQYTQDRLGEREERRRGRDGCPYRRHLRDGLQSQLRPQPLHHRHQCGDVGGTAVRPDHAADQQGRRRPVRAGLHVQDDGGAGGPGQRDRRPPP